MLHAKYSFRNEFIMKEIISFVISKVLVPLLFLFTISLQNLFANYTSVGHYSIDTNSSLNSTFMLNITAVRESDCLIKCLNIPTCLSLNILKGRMSADGIVTCHLFNVTDKSLSLKLVSNYFVDYYKTENFADCFDLKRERGITGVHRLRLRNGLQFDVYCDMETGDGGWTVIQKRFNGAIDFPRPWVDYKNGFGVVNGEYWLGLDAMHELTKSGYSLLKVDMWDNGYYAYAMYSNVKISDETQNYRLDYEALIDGTIPLDSMALSKGMNLSTYNQDNDKYLGSCSYTRGNAGWWFNECSFVNPNGVYTPGSTYPSVSGMYWDSFRGLHYSIQKMEMKLRRQ